MKTIWKGTLELLTPTFCRGAYKDQAELRPASIRGMFHWWFRALGGTAQEEKTAFGGMKRFGNDGTVAASSLVVRICATNNLTKITADTLPHKTGGHASPQAAFAPGGHFELEVTERFGRIDPALNRKLVNAIEVWTLLGALGLRANRAGGSIWPVGDHAPRTAAELRQRLDAAGCPWAVRLAPPETGRDLLALRKAATDTVKGDIAIFGSAARERQASAFKFKVVRLDGSQRLLVTAPSDNILDRAATALGNKPSRPQQWERI